MSGEASAVKSGQELDALVAERIFGWADIEPSKLLPSLSVGRPPGEQERTIVPAYSVNMADAWQVVEKITQPGFGGKSRGFPPGSLFAQWFKGANLWALSAEEAASAICRAALAATETGGRG